MYCRDTWILHIKECEFFFYPQEQTRTPSVMILVLLTMCGMDEPPNSHGESRHHAEVFFNVYSTCEYLLWCEWLNHRGSASAQIWHHAIEEWQLIYLNMIDLLSEQTLKASSTSFSFLHSSKIEKYSAQLSSSWMEGAEEGGSKGGRVDGETDKRVSNWPNRTQNSFHTSSLTTGKGEDRTVCW